MRDKILIYKDVGVADISELKQCLENYFLPQGILIEEVSADDILRRGALNDNVAAFFIPGGAATPYMNKLKVLGNQKIRDYVSAGGVYFGICAGAYYAAESLSFETDVPELALEQRCGLDLIKAHARGTLKDDFGLSPYDKPSVTNIAVTKVLWRNDGEVHNVVYHGGPAFEDVKDAEVLAVYQEAQGRPPAILIKSFGKGLVIVSGVHFENGALSFKMVAGAQTKHREKAEADYQKILSGEDSRKSLQNKLLKKIISQREKR